MKRQEITVKAKQGIHATPAIVLVNQARSYKSDIKLYKGSNGIDMKNVLLCGWKFGYAFEKFLVD